MEYRYTESDLIVPTLDFIKNNPRGVEMSTLVKYLILTLKPKGKDIKPNPSRKDSSFSQKVRNLTSHRTLVRKKLATYENRLLFITDIGKKYLENLGSLIEAVNRQGFTEKEKKIEFKNDYKNLIIEEGAVFLRSVKQRERSKKLMKEAKKYFQRKNNRLFCYACSFDFERKYDGLGFGYIEVHHTHPIHEHDIRGEKRNFLQTVKKLIPLCSNCHRMVHRNRKVSLTISDLKKILKKQELKK
mgnify:CR=1 FL=1